MKKFLHFILLTIMMMVSANTFAANYTWTDAPEGNLVSSADGFTATYTAKTTDVLNIGAPEVFTSVECNGETYSYKVVYGTETGAYKYSFNVKAGDVVTIKSDFWMNPGARVFISEGVLKLTMTNLSPGEQGKPFPWSTQGMVTVNFNKGVSASKVYILCPTLGNKTFDNVDDARLGGGSALSCDITNALESAYEAGLKPNMPFYLKFEGVKDEDGAKLADTGVLQLMYITPQQQGRLVSATVAGKPLAGYKFLSWFPTDEEEGLFVFEFSKEVAPLTGESYVELQFGNPDLITSGQYYTETLPCKVDGKTLTVDARGKLRSLTRLFPSVDFSALEEAGESEGYFEFNTSYIGMQLKNIKDTQGNPMYSSDLGSVGSYSYTFAYEEIKDDIVMDGDRPEDYENCIKESGSTVQLWVNQQLKSVDGVTVYIQVDNGLGTDPETEEQLYTTGQINIAKADIKIISSDPSDGTVLGFTLPELKAMVLEGGEVESGEPQMKPYEAASGTKIRIVLMVTTMNGMPHDLEVNYYNKENPTAITAPEALTTSKPQNLTFNLAGQKVGAGYRGIVIKNGKKVIMK